MSEKLDELMGQKLELLDALEDMVWQHCYQHDDDSFDSGALTTNARALRLLAKHNRFQIEREFGRMVVGKFIEEAKND